VKNEKKTKIGKNAESQEVKRKSLFDHVKHIRQVQHPDYYKNLSDEDKKSFNHFMILRALSMDEDLVEEMAMLYQVFDKIPSAQFYTLLIAMVPRMNKFSPWIKTKVKRNNKELLKVVGQRLQVPLYQANEYVNILCQSDNAGEVIRICQAMGLEDKEVDKLFEEGKDE